MRGRLGRLDNLALVVTLFRNLHILLVLVPLFFILIATDMSTQVAQVIYKVWRRFPLAPLKLIQVFSEQLQCCKCSLVRSSC